MGRLPSLADLDQRQGAPTGSALTGVQGPTGAFQTGDQLRRRTALHRQMAQQPIETRLPTGPATEVGSFAARMARPLWNAATNVGRVIRPDQAPVIDAARQAIDEEYFDPYAEASRSPTASLGADFLGQAPFFMAGGPATAGLSGAPRYLVQALGDVTAGGLTSEGTPMERLQQAVMAAAPGAVTHGLTRAANTGLQRFRGPSEIPGGRITLPPQPDLPIAGQRRTGLVGHPEVIPEPEMLAQAEGSAQTANAWREAAARYDRGEAERRVTAQADRRAADLTARQATETGVRRLHSEGFTPDEIVGTGEVPGATPEMVDRILGGAVHDEAALAKRAARQAEQAQWAARPRPDDGPREPTKPPSIPPSPPMTDAELAEFGLDRGGRRTRPLPHEAAQARTEIPGPDRPLTDMGGPRPGEQAPLAQQAGLARMTRREGPAVDARTSDAEKSLMPARAAATGGGSPPAHATADPETFWNSASSATRVKAVGVDPATSRTHKLNWSQLPPGAQAKVRDALGIKEPPVDGGGKGGGPIGPTGPPPPPGGPLDRKVFSPDPVGGGGSDGPGTPSPEVDAFFARTGNPPPKARTIFPRMVEQLRKTFVTSYRLRGSHKVHDPRLGEVDAWTSFADARNRIRLVADSGRHATATALDLMRGIVKPGGKSLTPTQYELLRRTTFVNDLLETANRGEKTPLSKSDLIAEKAKLDAQLARDPVTAKAVAEDQRLWSALADDLIRRKKLDPAKRRQYYVHHEVMDFLTGQTTAKLGRPGALRNVARKYLRRREGSAKDIYTNYLDVRYRSLAKVIRDNMVDDAVTQIADRYGVPQAQGEKLGYVPFSAEQIWDLPGKTSHDTSIMRFTKEIADTLPGNVGQQVMEAASQRLIKGKVWIHPDLAATLGELKDIHTEPGLLAKATSAWKQTMLNKNPPRYNFNNAVGDFERGWNAVPETFREGGPARMAQALRDIRDAARGKPSSDYRLAQRESVVDSGEVYHEIGSIKQSDLWRGLDPNQKGAWLHPIRTASSALRHASTARENLLRLMTFYANLDRMRAGKPLFHGVSDVRGLSDSVAIAAKVSREAYGDYGDFTPREGRLRQGLLPFYSWLKINTTFWPALFARKGPGVGVKGAARLAPKAALKTAGVVAKATAVYGAAAAWNNSAQQEQEESLPEDVRRRFHINTGIKDRHGKWITITEPTALSDFMSSIGVEGITTDVAQLLRGQLSAHDFVDQTARRRAMAPVRKVASRVTPAITAPVEAITGKKFYPDPLSPSESSGNNPLSRFLSGAGLGEFTDPAGTIDAYKKSWLGLGAVGVRRYDAGLSALRNIEERSRAFKGRLGYKDPGGSEGPKSDANRALFYALEDHQFDRAKALLAKTDRAAFARYLQARDPLRSIPLKHRAVYLRELGPSGIKQLNEARSFLKQIGSRAGQSSD